MKKTFMALVLILVVHSVFAAENPLWVEAEGEAYLGLYDTPKEIIERAKRDAQSKAIEQGIGVFIKSHTLVSNSQLADDLIYVAVRGRIEKVNVIWEGWDEKERNLYKIKLKALIKPVYPEKGESISLKLSLSKNVLKEGDEVKIFYQANSDCYIYIFSVAADGSVTLLLPNSMSRNNFIKAKEACEFPDSGSAVHLKAMFLPGYEKSFAEEKIKVIATKNKEDIIPLGFREGMFKVYDAKSTGMISDLVKKLNQLDPSEWTEGSLTYSIEKQQAVF
ncbi:MAG: DUF4384 domain-containing protein [Desulfobacterales bacterium]|nr:DUF4384 domain-containing protein [Desulfobacterales bacterium]